MAAFRWIQMSSLLILTLQFKGTTEQHFSTYTVTAGHNATLHCKNLIQGQRKCKNTTTWLFHTSENTAALFELGKKKEVKHKSGRLRLSVNCSLVIKKVKVQDAGHYTCRQYKNSQDYEDSVVHLSVINNATTIKLTTKKSTTRTLSTTQPATPTIKINTWTTKEEVMTSEGKAALKSSADWRWLIIASVGLAAFLITVVVIIRWKKTKEKTWRGSNTGQTREPINKLPLEGLSLNPADTQCDAGTSQDTAEADDGVPYASITFTKKTKNKAQAPGDDDDDDTVTYSTVKASSSSADPSNLYSTINKANKCS